MPYIPICCPECGGDMSGVGARPEQRNEKVNAYLKAHPKPQPNNYKSINRRYCWACDVVYKIETKIIRED